MMTSPQDLLPLLGDYLVPFALGMLLSAGACFLILSMMSREMKKARIKHLVKMRLMERWYEAALAVVKAANFAQTGKLQQDCINAQRLARLWQEKAEYLARHQRKGVQGPHGKFVSPEEGE